MATVGLETFGPPEAIDQGSSSLRGAIGVAGGGVFGPTSGGDDLDGSTLSIQNDSGNILNNLGLVGAVLELVITLLVALGEWIAGEFQGVPEQAKTIGTGKQLTETADAVTQFIGFQLVGGGANGRVLSEASWPQNFGGRVLAVGGAMIEWANREPPSKYWNVKNTPASSIAKFGDPPRQFRVGPVPPPSGAPYNDSVSIDGFFSYAIRTADQYKSTFGFDIPTPGQIHQFLKDTGGIDWNDSTIAMNTLPQMRAFFLDAWIAAYQTWLNTQPVIPPNLPVDPCFGTLAPPCPPTPTSKGDQLTDLISGEMTYLYFISVALQQLASAAQSPADQLCCANVTASISNVARQLQTLTQTVSASSTGPIDFTPVNQAILELNQTVAGFPALWTQLNADTRNGLNAISDAISNIDVTVDNSGIVDAIKQWNAINDIPLPVLQQMEADKIIPPAYSSFLQGSPAALVHAVLSALAFLSPPIGVLEKWLNDPDDATAADRARIAALKWLPTTMWRELTGVAGIAPGTFGAQLQQIFTKWLTASDATLEPLIKPLIGAIKNQLTPASSSSPRIGQMPVDPDAPVTAATGVALTAGLAAWAAAFAGVDEGEPLAKIAELIAGAVGLEQLRDVQIGPLVRNGIGAVAEQQAKATFREWLPGTAELLNLAARGLITTLNAEQLMPFNGVGDSMFPALEAAAYHGLQPRQLIRAFESGLFTNADLTDEMTFSGMRPASQHRMLLLAPYLASQTQRQNFKSAIYEATEKGVIDTPTMQAQLQTAEHDFDPVDLETRAIHLRQATANTLELQKVYVDLFVNGFTDDPTLRSNLAGIGLTSTQVTVVAAIAEVKQTLILKRQQAAAEKVLERETTAIERKVALEAFRNGTLNAVGLSAALVATGLTVVQVAAWTELAQLQQTGLTSWIYGQQLSPNDRQLLQQRVAALTQQRKDEQITGTQFITALQQLNITEPFQNALLARANAGITPKSDRILTPVETPGTPSLRRG